MATKFSIGELSPSYPRPLYDPISRYERVAWLPVLITFIIAIGVGGKHFINPPSAEPATASAILSFASTLAGFAITWAGVSADFTSYFKPDVSR